MSQNTQVLKHLQSGRHITALEALGLYGVYRLAARILDLRKAGHAIESEHAFDINGKSYARYRLAA